MRSCGIIISFIFLWVPFGDGQAQFVKERKFPARFGIGMAEVLTQEALSSTVLYLSPREFSQWEDKFWLYWGSNLKRAYTSPPVWDKDGWVVNYVGHPLQGSFFYNAVRSQGAGFWEAAGFNVFHTLFWEYFLEAINEQPSINDLITTTLAGVALGELSHRATKSMLKGGLTTWEKVAVTLINPFYAINNGYKRQKFPMR
jgi:hypothetical protein